MKKRVSVTVGIPAYNEESNIKTLIVSLLRQQQDTFHLKEIIVVSDGSTDNTVQQVLTVKSKKIKLFAFKKRNGKSFCLNVITKMSQSDILAQLDADILINDSHFIEKLIRPITRYKADLTSALIKEFWTSNKFEEILKVSMLMKKEIFERYKNGNNIYTCHGRARAMSRRLYKLIDFKREILADDAYAYVFTVKNKFKYLFARDAHIHYKLPKTLADHEKQSIRFFQSYKQLESEFGKGFLTKHTMLPRSLSMKALIAYFNRYPITMFSYLTILFYMKWKALIRRKINVRWEVASSSKTIAK